MNSIQAIVEAEWTPEVLLFLYGVVQSLVLEYVPYVKDWYGGLEEQWKRFSQAVLLFVITLVVFGLACADIVGGLSCDRVGIVNILLAFFLALIANQTTHRVFKKRSHS